MAKRESLVKENPREIRKFTNEKLNKKESIPSSLSFDGSNFSDPQIVADKFTDMFEKLYTPDNSCSSLVEAHLPISSNNDNQPITKEEVIEALRKLKGSSSCGPDLIPPYIIKGCGEHLTMPLCYLFNLCIKCSVYPRMWKSSRICPIFKKGDRNDAQNYRAISILNCFSKCLETILYKRLLHHTKSFIAPEQHGFMKGRSTVTNLCVFTSSVSECLNNKNSVDCIYFDFSKAFDTVNHSILILKLINDFEIPMYLVALLKNYLEGRTQYVAYRGACSKIFRPVSSVPQGSNLGPLLFNLFINDLPKYIKNSTALMYADDLKVFRVVNDENDAELLQRDVDNISEWLLLNKMQLNKNKCETMHFTCKRSTNARKYIVDGTYIKAANVIKDLGVLIDNKLTFQSHIVQTAKSANKILSFLTRLGHHFQNVSTLVFLYNGLVRSRLEYASVIWNPTCSSYIQCVEKVQKRFLRFLYFRDCGVYPHYLRHPVSTDELLLKFNYVTLKKRRTYNDCLFIYKILNNYTDCSVILGEIKFKVNIKNTRHQNLIVGSLNKKSPLNKIIKNFNNQNCDPFCLIKIFISQLL